jgi:hypothetical protein
MHCTDRVHTAPQALSLLLFIRLLVSHSLHGLKSRSLVTRDLAIGGVVRKHQEGAKNPRIPSSLKNIWSYSFPACQKIPYFWEVCMHAHERDRPRISRPLHCDHQDLPCVRSTSLDCIISQLNPVHIFTLHGSKICFHITFLSMSDIRTCSLKFSAHHSL